MTTTKENNFFFYSITTEQHQNSVARYSHSLVISEKIVFVLIFFPHLNNIIIIPHLEKLKTLVQIQ